MARSNVETEPLAAARDRHRVGRRVGLGMLPVLAASTGVWLAGAERLAALDRAWSVTLVMVVVMAAGGTALLQVPEARAVATVLLGGSVIWAAAILSVGIFVLSAGTGVVIDDNHFLIAFSQFCLLLGPTIPVLLMQVFPAGVIDRRWAGLIFSLSLSALVCTSAAVGLVPPLSQQGEPTWAWASYLGTVTLGYVLGVAILTLRFMGSATYVRRQLLAFSIVQFGLTVGFVAVLLTQTTLSDQAAAIMYAVWTLGVVLSILVGMVRHHLYGVRFIVRRVAVHGAATIILSGIFAGAYLALSAALSARLDLDNYGWLAVGISVSIVLLVDPLRRRSVGHMESRLLGDRRRPLEAFARLALDNEGALDAATYASMLHAVVAAVRAPWATLVIREGTRTRVAAAFGSPAEDAITLAMSYRGELLGHLRIGLRTPGEKYRELDVLLLQQLSARVAGHIYVIRRDQELAESRREALTAVVEERDRLGRSLHDGLAPLLAGAGLTADALRRDLPPDSAGERDAARLSERLRHAAGELRDIAHGLAPGGLAGPLDQAVNRYLEGLSGPGVPDFEASFDVGPLQPVVANAAYLVILEAVNNVVRHAGAKRATVTIRAAEDTVVLCIADDGQGIQRPYVSGFGITSMRKRAEALGGTFAINANEGGGTLIETVFPVAP